VLIRRRRTAIGQDGRRNGGGRGRRSERGEREIATLLASPASGFEREYTPTHLETWRQSMADDTDNMGQNDGSFIDTVNNTVENVAAAASHRLHPMIDQGA